jgi:hypothetical protein
MEVDVNVGWRVFMVAAVAICPVLSSPAPFVYWFLATITTGQVWSTASGFTTITTPASLMSVSLSAGRSPPGQMTNYPVTKFDDRANLRPRLRVVRRASRLPPPPVHRDSATDKSAQSSEA